MTILHYHEMWVARARFLELALPTVCGNRYLAAHRIEIAHVTNVAGPIIEMEIFALPGDIFDFCENREGFLAFVMMVFDRDAETPIDFIAWTRDRPNRVYRYFNYADAIGVDQLYNPATYFADQGLMVHRTPLDWLFARCEGVAVFDHDVFRDRLVHARTEVSHCRLVGASISRAQHLRKVLSPVPENVQIFVPASKVAA